MPNFTEDNDFLNRSTILSVASVKRTYFDPLNQEHLDSLKSFIETGNWGKIQFYCEFPFSDVPMTVLMKFAGNHLSCARETAATRLNRLEQREKT